MSMSSERMHARSVVKDYKRFKNNQQALEEEMQLLESDLEESEIEDDNVLDYDIEDVVDDDDSDHQAKAS